MARSDIKDLRRQQLIEATIVVIARKGFSSTTLADVAKEARMSYGIVSFYFKNKDSLLVSTLSALAEEYDAFSREALQRAGADPADKLVALIEADFHPAISSRKKVSVWSAFWSEGRANPAFKKLCAELDAAYLKQTEELVQEIIDHGGHRGLDAHLISVGLNALMDGLWLDLQIQPETFDREAAKRICRHFLSALFPSELAAAQKSVA